MRGVLQAAHGRSGRCCSPYMQHAGGVKHRAVSIPLGINFTQHLLGFLRLLDVVRTPGQIVLLP